jgi:hypothetical protein
VLVGDDRVHLDASTGQLVVRPVPELAGLRPIVRRELVTILDPVSRPNKTGAASPLYP